MTSDVAVAHLRSGVSVHQPLADGGPWLVERSSKNPLRVGSDAGALLSRVDGRADSMTLATELGEPWNIELVDQALAQFEELEVIALGADVERQAPVKPQRRLIFQPPMLVQLRLVRGERILGPLRPLLARLPGGPMLWTALVVGMLGVLALLMQASRVHDVLGRPVSLATIASIWLALSGTTILHELSHGATLTRFGGRSGWLGVMFFYLTPACFCEITESWRLPHRRQRVLVALAGVLTQITLAGGAAIAAITVPDGAAVTILLGFALACYLTAAFNLLPLVKLDGYIALMSFLDTPHLRDKAMTDARRWWIRLLGGRPSARELPHRRWAVPYGIACATFPLVIMTLAVTRWCRNFLVFGPLGAVFIALLVGYLLYRLVASGVKFGRQAHRDGVSGLRVGGVVATGCAALIAIGMLIHVPANTQAGYVRDGDRVALVFPLGADPGRIRPGQTVALGRSGLVFSRQLATARTAGTTVRTAKVPLSAVSSIAADSPVEASVLPLTDVSAGNLDRTGTASIEGDPTPLGVWIGRRYLAPLWNQLFG